MKATGRGLAGALMVLLMFMALATPVLADLLPGVWRAVGASVDGRPVGDAAGLAGRVSAVAVMPGRAPVELVGTLGGVWRRIAARPWRDVTSRTWPSTAVGAIAVDPVDPRVAYAGTGYDEVDADDVQPGAGVLKSTDAGLTWQPLSSSTRLMAGYAVTGLAVDPRNHRVVVAATNNGVFRSADGGNNWRTALPVAPGPYGISEVRLAVDPVTGTMLAGVAQSGGVRAHSASGTSASGTSASSTITTGHAMYVSTDGGLSWSAFAVDRGTGQGDVLVPAIATTRGQRHVTYAYALDITGDRTAGLYISHDGRRWTRTTGQNVVTKFSIGQLVADPVHPNVAYFAQEDPQFYRYAFAGRTTQPLIGRAGGVCRFGDFRALTLGPSLLVSAHEALYGGEDGGTCYVDLSADRYVNNNAGLISGLDYSAAAASPTEELSGAQDLGADLYSGGATTREVYHADGYGVLIDRRSTATLYAAVNPPGGPQSFVVSRDRGRSWQQIPLSPPPGDVFGATLRLVQAKGAPDLLILPSSQSTLYVSADDGRHWAARAIPLSGGDYISAVRAAQFPGARTPDIYAGTGFGRIWRSGDLGRHWSQLPVDFGPLSVRDLALDPAASTGPAAERLFVAVGAYATEAYATYDTVGDVWRSRDSGRVWKQIGQALKRTSVNVLALNGSTLLAGTDFGIERYTGIGWTPAARALPRVRVNDLGLSADGRSFFAATFGRGIWEAPATTAARP